MKHIKGMPDPSEVVDVFLHDESMSFIIGNVSVMSYKKCPVIINDDKHMAVNLGKCLTSAIYIKGTPVVWTVSSNYIAMSLNGYSAHHIIEFMNGLLERFRQVCTYIPVIPHESYGEVFWIDRNKSIFYGAYELERLSDVLFFSGIGFKFLFAANEESGVTVSR